MLSKENRLRKEKDFKVAWKNGRSYISRYIIIKIRKNSRNISRFGIIVSNKISKKSTKRNHQKRRIREIIRLKLSEIKPGFDCVVIARQGILEKKYQEIEEEIKKILQKTRLIK